MASKAADKPATKNDPIFYDARIPQTIPFEHVSRGKTYKLAHTVDALSTERFFALEADIERAKSRATRLTADLYEPKLELWREIVTMTTGYKERDDWRQRMHPSDAIAVITALLHINVLDAEVEGEETEDLFDVDELTAVHFQTLFNGVLLTGMAHHFRPESKAQMNEFLALETGETNPNALASAVKKTKAEKLYELGMQLLEGRDGYADGSPVAPWHLVVTTEAYFIRQIARMGKF